MTTLVIDGTNWAHRAFHALKAGNYGIPVSPSGQPIAACSVVIPGILKLCSEYQISRVFVAFDGRGKTFRHDLFPGYKAKRKESEDRTLLEQDIAQLADLLALMGVAVMAPSGYEADDVVATIATQAPGKVLVHSSDKDLYQLVSDRCQMLAPAFKGGLNVLDAEAVQVKMGVPSSAIPDYKALVGDSSDCIPGIKGIGEKMGVELLTLCPTIEEIYQNLDSLPAKCIKKLTQPGAQELAKTFKAIATTVSTLQLDTGDGIITPEPAASVLESLGLRAIAANLVNATFRILQPVYADR